MTQPELHKVTSAGNQKIAPICNALIGRQAHKPDICKMKIAVVAATPFELMHIEKQARQLPNFRDSVQVTFHTTGVGILASTYQLTMLVKNLQPDIIIQAGIAGSFDVNLPIGNIVVVEKEYNGDVGVVENDAFKDVFDMKLVEANEFPFEVKALVNPWLKNLNLLTFKEINGVTVNEITTSHDRITQLKQKYNCSIESMEGAALHYVCLQTNTPFMQVRAISNYVGERNKTKWNIKLALDQLAHSTASLIQLLADENRSIRNEEINL
ncbi:MAG: futalosine hydrolase [Chitinophagaceae bacterium]|nr:futalosine hydrolase [Chitinophagaceae bacterium]